MLLIVFLYLKYNAFWVFVYLFNKLSDFGNQSKLIKFKFVKNIFKCVLDTLTSLKFHSQKSANSS